MSSIDKPSSDLLRRILLPCLFVASGFYFNSCSLGGFFGAYFNTYYNARRVFGEAEEEIRTQQKTTVKEGPQKYLPPFNIQPNTRTKLTSVIEKCSKLLQYHPESSLVDDALLMVGKAYYYQDENQKAERKFKELLSGYPESDLHLEAKLLLSHVYYRMNDPGQATDTAKVVLAEAQQSGDDDMVARAATVIANIELENKNYPQSISFFEIAAEKRSSADERALAYVKIAEVYQKQSDLGKAIEAYRRAEREGGSYLTNYQARIGQARMTARLGQPKDAMDILEQLRSDTNNKEFYGEIDLEIGNTFKQMNSLEEAVAQYTFVDTTYARTEVAAKAYYELGLLYETRLALYDSARVAYNKGKLEFPPSEITPLITQHSDVMNRYALLRDQLAKYDSLRSAILHPDTVAADSESIQQDSTVINVSHGDTVKVKVKKGPAPLPTLASLDSMQARASIEIASLFYSSIGAIDSARVWFQRLLSDHPNSPYTARALFMQAQIAAQDSIQGRAKSDSIYRILTDRFPDTEVGHEAARFLGMPVTRKADVADQLYERASKLLASGNDSAAIDTFLAIVHEYPSSPIASKAQYAVGWVYQEVQSRPDSALASYQRLVAEYPNSEYATLVKPMIAEVDKKKKEEEEAARQDSIKRATASAPTKKVSPADSLSAPSPGTQELQPKHPPDSIGHGSPQLPTKKVPPADTLSAPSSGTQEMQPEQPPDSTASSLKKPDTEPQKKPRVE